MSTTARGIRPNAGRCRRAVANAADPTVADGTPELRQPDAQPERRCARDDDGSVAAAAPFGRKIDKGGAGECSRARVCRVRTAARRCTGGTRRV